jgi:hypothetical protein
VANLDKKNVKKECLWHLLSKKTLIIMNISGIGFDVLYLSMKCAETIRDVDLKKRADDWIKTSAQIICVML